MSITSSQTLRGKKCVPCEGGVPVISAEEAQRYAQATPKWIVAEDGKSIFRKLTCANFTDALQLMNRVGEIAETEQHHPDLHLTGYRKVRIDLTTHAIDGLSENDFIVAAKIDEILE